MAKTVRQTLKGRGDFISDIYVRDMLYGATLRSPYARAAIRAITRTGLPRGVTCLTAADIPGKNSLSIESETMPVLAAGECRYAGEPIALLAGPSQRAVIEAMQSIDIEYEELPAVFSYAQPSESQIIASREGTRGDPETAIADSANRVEGTYRTGIQEHLYNEPQGAVALHEDDLLVLRSATQWPFHVRTTVAACLGLPEERVVVRAASPGISLDGKLWYPSLVAAHAALLANATGKPIKLVYSNIEDFRYTPKRAPFIFRFVTGVSQDGRVSGNDVEVLYNAGAYGLFTDEISERIVAATMALYDCPNLRVRVTAARTNLPPLNVLSGFGSSSAFFATETHVSRIAELGQIDPLNWRLQNLAGRSSTGGAARAKPNRPERVILPVARESDFARKFAAYELQKKRRTEFSDQRRSTQGIGIALGLQGAGPVTEGDALRSGTISVQLQSDGSAILRTSAVPGSRVVVERWRLRIAEILGLEPSDVTVENSDTAEVPDSGPSTLSRNVAVVSRLIDQACNAIQKRRFRAPLPIEVRRSYRSARGQRYDSGTLTGDAFPNRSYGAAVVEVDIDPVAFETNVRNVWFAADAGRILDETEARRALEMAIYQSVEWATHEVVVYRDGAIDPRSYLTYRNVTRPVIPSIHISLIDSADENPEGLGELPQSCVPAALAAAVSQATGRYMDQLPTNPALIHDYLETE